MAWGDISGARFAVDLTIFDALEIARDLRVCGWLTAPRRVAGIVQTRTVARAQKRLAATASDTPSSSDNSDAETARGALQWLLVVVPLIVVGIVSLWLAERRDQRREAGKSPPGPSGETSADAAVAASTDPSPDYEFVQRRHGEEVAFAIQRAVGTTADVYRDRLRRILEHQDGPDWLAAFNARRRADMLAKGQGPGAAYASLEPRAVLNCLAYDPAGLQLIDLDAVAAARQLCGLANAAHHPTPTSRSPTPTTNGHGGCTRRSPATRRRSIPIAGDDEWRQVKSRDAVYDEAGHLVGEERWCSAVASSATSVSYRLAIEPLADVAAPDEPLIVGFDREHRYKPDEALVGVLRAIAALA